MPRSPRDYGKNAVQVPPKLSEERRTVAFMPRVVLPVGEDEYVRDGLCADEPERRDVHDGGVHVQVHGQAVGEVRRAVDRLHREEHPEDWLW